MSSDPTDQHRELVLRLAVQHRVHILTTLVALVRDLDTAEDLLQDTLVAILQDPDAYDPAFEFLPWARGVARNRVRRHWQRKNRPDQAERTALETLADIAEAAPVPALDGSDRLHGCLERLPERSRRLLHLRYSENLVGPELARQAGMPAGSLRTTLARLRQVLRQCLQAQPEPQP